MLYYVSKLPFFLKLDNILLYVYTTFCLYTHLLYTDGHSGCFHLLATVNKTKNRETFKVAEE